MELRLTTVRLWPELKWRVGCSTSWATKAPLPFLCSAVFHTFHPTSPVQLLRQNPLVWPPGLCKWAFINTVFFLLVHWGSNLLFGYHQCGDPRNGWRKANRACVAKPVSLSPLRHLEDAALGPQYSQRCKRRGVSLPFSSFTDSVVSPQKICWSPNPDLIWK